jgi:hypothetical protein
MARQQQSLLFQMAWQRNQVTAGVTRNWSQAARSIATRAQGASIFYILLPASYGQDQIRYMLTDGRHRCGECGLAVPTTEGNFERREVFCPACKKERARRRREEQDCLWEERAEEPTAPCG